MNIFQTPSNIIRRNIVYFYGGTKDFTSLIMIGLEMLGYYVQNDNVTLILDWEQDTR